MGSWIKVLQTDIDLSYIQVETVQNENMHIKTSEYRNLLFVVHGDAKIWDVKKLSMRNLYVFEKCITEVVKFKQHLKEEKRKRKTESDEIMSG